MNKYISKDTILSLNIVLLLGYKLELRRKKRRIFGISTSKYTEN